MNAPTKFQAKLQMIMAQYYRQALSERITAGIKAAQKHKLSNK